MFVCMNSYTMYELVRPVLYMYKLYVQFISILDGEWRAKSINAPILGAVTPALSISNTTVTKENNPPSNTTESKKAPNGSSIFAGWEFWEPQYSCPPIMLSQDNCPQCIKDAKLKSYLPKTEQKHEDIFGKNASCAVVSSSSDLKNYKYGELIDSHDVILRFNNHDKYKNLPKENYGSKKTHMMMHCGIWNKGEKEIYKRFDFFENREEFVIMFHARMYWDMKKHPGKLSDSYWKSQLIPHYNEFYDHRKNHLNKTVVLHHDFIWQAYVAYEKAAGRKASFKILLVEAYYCMYSIKNNFIHAVCIILWKDFLKCL